MKGEQKNSMTQEERYERDCAIVNEPFYFRGVNGIGVLLFHGWSSTPYEMRLFGEYLHSQGYSVYAPLLGGHGTRPEDLEGVRWQQWRDEAFAAYEFLRGECDRVFVGGMSMGGSLGVHVAARYGDVAGLIIMGMPYKMRYEKIGYFAVRQFMKYRPYKKKMYPKVMGAERCMTELIAYQRYPYTAAFEALYAIKSSLHILGKVRQPSMIVQSQNDYLIVKDSVERIAASLGSDEVKKRVLKKAYHNFIADEQHSYIYEEIVDFIESYT